MKTVLLATLVLICFTSVQACADDPTANCAAKKALCKDARYDDVMNKMCPVTCDRCKEPKCADRDQRCPSWEKYNQFCESTSYTAAEKEATCAKTCKFCTPN